MHVRVVPEDVQHGDINQHQKQEEISALNMEAASFSEVLLNTVS
jgi:hypothetical protein